MKIAVTGKGGVGKTLICATLAKLFVDKNFKVFAVDADPDANLALTLGFPQAEKITSLVEMKKLIEERTGAKSGSFSPYFKMNPKVGDIPDKYFVKHNGISLAVMGTVRGGGLGCTCPENAFLKALLRHLIVEREEVVILDMEAGIEHLGRGTVESVDILVIVVEPGVRSIETAKRIRKLAGDIGISRLGAIGNKTRNDSDKKFMIENIGGQNLNYSLGIDFLGYISYNKKLVDADLKNLPFYEVCPEVLDEGKVIVEGLMDGREKK